MAGRHDLPGPVQLDHAYPFLGREPALTVLSHAFEGPFGDKAIQKNTEHAKAIDEWRRTTHQTTETAHEALDKTLTPEAVEWLRTLTPHGNEVRSALEVLATSRDHAHNGGQDPQPEISTEKNPDSLRPSRPGFRLPDHGAESRNTDWSRAVPQNPFQERRTTADESLLLLDELGPLVKKLPRDRYRDLISRAGRATTAERQHSLLKRLHTDIANIASSDVREAVQGSRFHRHLSDELLRIDKDDTEVGKNNRSAFTHHEEAQFFQKKYVVMHQDGSGMWIREPSLENRERRSVLGTLPDPGYFSVTVHGDPDAVNGGVGLLSARDLANLLRHTPEWADDKRPIRLLACNTGETDDGFAQQLADALGVEVKAPNTMVWNLRGPAYASSSRYHPDGTIRPGTTGEVDGAFRIFTPAVVNADGSVHHDPPLLDLTYRYLGRGPALTVLSHAIAGRFGDKLIDDAPQDARPGVRRIVEAWRDTMGQAGEDTESQIRFRKSAHSTLDKVLTPETVEWMQRFAPPGTEVDQALRILAESRHRTDSGGKDPQPVLIAHLNVPPVEAVRLGNVHGTPRAATATPTRSATPTPTATRATTPTTVIPPDPLPAKAFDVHVRKAGLRLDEATVADLSAIHHHFFSTAYPVDSSPRAKRTTCSCSRAPTAPRPAMPTRTSCRTTSRP
ncbi:hypothetical protein ACFQ9X_00925 [Catenulispora yoronensis]